MFDFSFSEFVVVALVGLICIGPKELPGLLRTLGRIVGGLKRQVQGFMHEIQAIEEAPTRRILGDDGRYYEAYELDDQPVIKAEGQPHGKEGA